VAHSTRRVWLEWAVSVAGYVVMPEHIHLLIGEPERGKSSLAFLSS
jgi:REP element-mobilizing transposase RayT